MKYKAAWVCGVWFGYGLSMLVVGLSGAGDETIKVVGMIGVVCAAMATLVIFLAD